MPDLTPTVTSHVATTVAPVTVEAVPVRPAAVSAHLSRAKGKVTLRLDVRGLHAYLDSLGIEQDGYQRYAAAPASVADVVDTNTHTLCPKALLSKKYFRDPTTRLEEKGILMLNLMASYQTPPNRAALQSIADSIEAAYTTIIGHYQPVEITVSLVGKAK